MTRRQDAGAPTAWRDIIRAWQNWPLVPQLLSLTIPLGLLLGFIPIGQSQAFATRVASSFSAPLAAWTWVLCPLLGLVALWMLLRVGDRRAYAGGVGDGRGYAGRIGDGRTYGPEAWRAGLIAGGACGLLIRSGAYLLYRLPLPVKAELDLTWQGLWRWSALVMVMAAPLVAVWWERTLRTAATRTGATASPARRALGMASGAGHGTHGELITALVWGLVGAWVMVLTGATSTLFRTVAPSARDATTITAGILAAVVIGGAIAGVSSAAVSRRWQLGPYATTASFMAFLGAICFSGSLLRPGLVLYWLLPVGMLVLPALALLLVALVTRAAPVGTKKFDFAIAGAIGVGVVVLAFALTPQLQVSGINLLLKQGRRSHSASEVIQSAHGRTGVRVLLQLLESPDENVRKQAQERLAELGKSHPRDLLRALPAASNSARCLMIYAIAESGDRRMARPLIRVMERGLPQRRAPGSPGAPSPPRALPAWLRRLLPSRPPPPPTSGLTVTNPGPESMPGHYLYDPGPDAVRAGAARALGVLGDQAATRPLIAALQDKSGEVRANVAFALAELKAPTAAEPLRQALTDPNLGVRREAARGLGEIGYQPAAPDLLAMLSSDVGDTPEVAGALAQLHLTQAVPRLTELLVSDTGDNYRQEYLDALVTLRGGTFEPLLQGALAHPDSWFYRRKLKDLHRDRAVAKLIPMLRDPAKQAAAVEVLRFLDTTEAREALSHRGLSPRGWP